MSLEKIENTIEKLTKNNHKNSTEKSFFEISEELTISQNDLENWVEIFDDLKPKITQDNQQYFTNRQFNTIKKIKKFIDDQDGDIIDLAETMNQNIIEKKTPNYQSNQSKNQSLNKQHYFDKNNFSKDQNIESTLVKDEDQKSYFLDIKIDQENIDNSENSDFEKNNDLDSLLDITQDQKLKSIPESIELASYRNIDLTAKLQDFSNIKLYNIHPKINQQIQHRLKCAKLNLEELNNLLKNL
jgi:hypothetical protein